MAALATKYLRPVHFVRNVLQSQRRYLNLLEYQSKGLLQESGVAIQEFCVLDGTQGPNTKNLDNFKVPEYVVKAQILAGGRGKGHFDTGFKGGVHITTKSDEVMQLVEKMVGNKLITKQTPPEGIEVKKVMVAKSINITRETYLCIVMDRDNSGPVLIASPAGGMDIETVAEETPEKLLKVPIDITVGLTKEKSQEIARFLEFNGDLIDKASEEILKLWKLFLKLDAVQIEINPLAETDNGQVISVDAKLDFDDNARFRHQDIFDMEDLSESDPKEVEASKYNLNYVAMNGNIGCLVNGAGLAMATMDIIKLNGSEPANFLDVGGNVNEDQVLKAFEILLEDKNVKAILVNVFGGIVNCATIANGIVNAFKKINPNVPMIVRLAGTNAEQAKEILLNSGLPIQSATNLDDAASLAVKSIK
ncbi:succinate--CoA ligase [GDP-forming] subunit beta, mitochondrial [Sitodiplosis mosellana]|uniref:succinate--CoA ligase [GDP-forming] subunit beta, mitochondrial n=1 Tax=Sitodiplosis mosellana TaxID=263140 RepID=UPI00244530A7|nr:succinate--CoA ligase [GDP-forming] subunit beta, mitochondrial [Sitodiplosis mosellana]